MPPPLETVVFANWFYIADKMIDDFQEIIDAEDTHEQVRRPLQDAIKVLRIARGCELRPPADAEEREDDTSDSETASTAPSSSFSNSQQDDIDARPLAQERQNILLNLELDRLKLERNELERDQLFEEIHTALS
jgi:hypothetical protein